MISSASAFYLRRASNYIRRQIIKASGYLPQVNYYLDSAIAAPREDVDRLSLFAEAQTFSKKSLIHVQDNVVYSYPRMYVYGIPDAIVDIQANLVYDRYGLLIAESSSYPLARLIYDIPRPTIKPPSRLLNGVFAFFSTSNNYYHWLLEDLPAFLAAHAEQPSASVLRARRCKLRPSIEFCDRFLSENNQVLIDEPLVRVEYLLMCSKGGGQGNPFAYNILHPACVRLLRSWFDSNFPAPEFCQEPLKVYLSRSRWKRAMEGEEVLEQLLEQDGFNVFHGDLGFFEQIRLFRSASLICGQSGAAMANMVWMKPGSSIAQFQGPTEAYSFYYDLAQMLNHKFHSLTVSSDSYDRDRRLPPEEITRLYSCLTCL